MSCSNITKINNSVPWNRCQITKLIKITNFFNKKTKTQEQDRNVSFLNIFI